MVSRHRGRIHERALCGGYPCGDRGVGPAGVEVIILGCTELPLIFPERDIRVRDRLISLVDPTEILARRCVAHAMTHSRR